MLRFGEPQKTIYLKQKVNRKGGEKMTCTYCMKQDVIRDEEKRPYAVYGIEAVSPEGKILLSFSDLFFDREKAESLVTLCNDGELSLSHLPDVVEDALAY